MISIHEVFADLDLLAHGVHPKVVQISIHEVFADLDRSLSAIETTNSISIHEVFADLDYISTMGWKKTRKFQSTRSSQTSTVGRYWYRNMIMTFQSTRSSQTSTEDPRMALAVRRFQSTRSSQTSTDQGGAVCPGT